MTEVPSSDVAFSPAVKAIQAARGSRESYARMERRGGWRTELTPDIAGFIAAQRSFYLASASADGQPYIQHRGGPPGFLRVLDAETLAFADLSGNRQYITLGNLSENPRVQLFLMDYANRRRVKIWGEARVVQDDPALLAMLMPEGATGRAEQAIVIRVTAWDTNCHQHIPQRFEAEEVLAAIEKRDARIAELEAEVAQLKGGGRSELLPPGSPRPFLEQGS
jgi:predicted pyridoxine 5'-phosphate oxidase superfamily flavin-nucleotide-binding protein